MSTRTLITTQPHGQSAPGRDLKPPSFARLRPDRQPPDPRRPFAHQREAWTRLSEHLDESHSTGDFAGLLVMPTGSGKTFTASTWLMREVVDHGGRVLWLAHRDELLEQAADAFHRAVGLARHREQVAVRIVSGRHYAASKIGPGDDVMIGSVASLARQSRIVTRMLDDPRTFVILDEAHHAPAPSYRAILDQFPITRRRRLLGLTATPTRTLARERPELNELFGNRILHEVDAVELIEREVLARPTIVRVATHAKVERGLTRAEVVALDQGGDFDPARLNQIARNERRNQAIVDHFLRFRRRYGKTLIFAIDVEQAVHLANRFRAAGLGADYVARNRRDGRDNRAILRRFRDPAGDLDVLVNVQLLTEGVDLPAVQTVVLARPTTSAILASQMAGRALRGPAVGGTEVAYLVALQDDWRRLSHDQDPFHLVPDLVELASTPTSRGIGRRPGWAPLREVDEAVASKVRALIPSVPTDSSESVPERWYVLGDPDSDRMVPIPIANFSHQRHGWDALINHLTGLPAEALSALDVATLTTRFFAECEAPLPSARDLDRVLEHYRHGFGRPASYGPEERLACDPRSLARQIVEEDLAERARTELLDRRYTPLARAIYPTLRDFRAAVDDAVFESMHPEAAIRIDLTTPVYETR